MKYFLLLILSLTQGATLMAEYKSTLLTPSLFFLEGEGGNITASLGEDGVLLVDDDFSEMADKLVLKLKDIGGAAPRFIINTHFHYDHTGGNEIFGKTATIIAANEVRDRLQHEQILWKKTHPAVPHFALPQVTFEDSLNLHVNSDDIRIHHLPHSHTDGDTVVIFTKNKVASLGDLYFSGMYPIFHTEHSGSIEGLLKNLEWVLKEMTTDFKIVPGHGPLSNKKELIQYYEMIQTSYRTVSKSKAEGHTLEQIQKAGLPPSCEPFSHGYATTDRWLEMIYSAIH